MRRPTTFLPAVALLAAVAFATDAMAQPDPGQDEGRRARARHTHHPGYVDGSVFIEMADPDGRLIEVSLKGKLLKLLTTRALRRHDEQLATILGELVAVQAVIAEIDREYEDTAHEQMERIRRRLLDRRWDRFVRVRKNGEEYSAFVHIDEDEEIDGLVVLGFTEDREVMFVNCAGRIDLERIVLLTERFGLPTLDDLPTADEIDAHRRDYGPPYEGDGKRKSEQRKSAPGSVR